MDSAAMNKKGFMYFANSFTYTALPTGAPTEPARLTFIAAIILLLHRPSQEKFSKRNLTR
jgi:hypothetical protein